MPTPESVTVLLVSEQAEEIKFLTTSLRSLYPGCRVEAVYSPNEAMEWVMKADWQVILFDEQLLPQDATELLADLRRRSPSSAIIVLTEQGDERSAAKLLQGGADHYLFKKSAGAVAELMVALRDVLEKGDLRGRIAITQSRYLRLVEVVHDLVFELDVEGRFSFISQNVVPLLGYSPQELIGAHYSTLLPVTERPRAEYRFNERRTGARATRNAAFRLIPKQRGPGEPRAVEVEINTKGLYDRRNRFVGTIGIAGDLSRHSQDTATIQRLAEQERQVKKLAELQLAMSEIAGQLSAPLAGVLEETSRLLHRVQELRLEQSLQIVVSYASKASRFGEQLAAFPLADRPSHPPVSINALMEAALSLTINDLERQNLSVQIDLDDTDPLVPGHETQLRDLFVILIRKAGQALSQGTAGTPLRMSTRRVVETGGTSPVVLISLSGLTAGMQAPDRAPTPADAEDSDWATACWIIERHGGEVVAASFQSTGVLLRIRLPSSEGPQEPSPDVPPEPHPAPKAGLPSPTRSRAPEAGADRPQQSTATVNAERRRSPRTEVQIEARLSQEGATWVGRLLSMSLNGMYMLFEGLIPAAANQPIQLALTSEGAVLQLRGTVRSVQEADRRRVGAKVFPAFGIAVELAVLGRDERLILGSLMDELPAHTLAVTLTALLPPAESADLLVEAGSAGKEAAHAVSLEPFPPEAGERSATEQRFASRVSFVIPAYLEILDPSAGLQRHDGRTLNVSVAGTCMRLQAPPDLSGRCVRLGLVLPKSLQGDGLRLIPGSGECRLLAQVTWTALDHSIGWAPSGGSSVPLRVGLRFLHIDEAEERQVEHLVAELLIYPLRIEEWAGGSSLVSTLMECRNHKGHHIAISYDRPKKPLPPGSPLAVIAPGFGETKRDYIFLSYALASNGFHVLRYDHTEHVGESEGEMMNTSCFTMKQDLLAMLRFAAHTWPASPILLFASGLTGRIALKAVTQRVRVNLLILLESILDPKATLQAVHGKDVLRSDPEHGGGRLINVLGFNVDGARWLDDLRQGGYADLESTVQDVGAIDIPTILVAAEGDPYVPYPSVQQVQAALGPHLRRAHLLPEPFTRLHQAPTRDAEVYRQLVADSLEHCYPATPRERIHAPPLREVRRQELLERDRLQARRGRGKPVTLTLWAENPGDLEGMVESSDYWRLLDDIYRLSGRLQGAERILDAACGTGHFGLVLLINQAFRRMNTRTKEFKTPYYVGLDSQAANVARTRRNLARLSSDLRGKFAGAEPPVLMRTSLCVSYPHRPLPFAAESYDLVVCNLAISTFPDPVGCLREFMRVLVPNGNLILTSLKPHADLTVLYRRLLTRGLQGDEVDQAERFLANWGTTLEQERNGLLRFYDRQALLALLASAGATKPRVYTSLANQANIAVGEKLT